MKLNFPADEKKINTITPISVHNDRFFRGTISYKDDKKLIWDSWKSVFNTDKEWFQVFHETAIKKEL